MKKILKAIDGGAGVGPAPRPRRGLMQLMYDIVDAIGESTAAKIYEYVPAAISKPQQVVSRSKVDKSLYQCVYQGYMVTHKQGNDELFRIAPVSYFKARQELLKANKGAPNGKRERGECTPDYTIVFARPFWHWSLLALVAVCSMLAGVLIGLSL